MIEEWHVLCISDKTGKQFFKTTASPMSTMSEIKNLQRHIECAKSKNKPQWYAFLDADSAVILLDGTVYGAPMSDLDADQMLKELEL